MITVDFFFVACRGPAALDCMHSVVKHVRVDFCKHLHEMFHHMFSFQECLNPFCGSSFVLIHLERFCRARFIAKFFFPEWRYVI